MQPSKLTADKHIAPASDCSDGAGTNTGTGSYSFADLEALMKYFQAQAREIICSSEEHLVIEIYDDGRIVLPYGKLSEALADELDLPEDHEARKPGFCG